MNEAGEALLSFCTLNQLSVMNIFFEKRSIHKHTWQHPSSEKWYCIDFVMMKQKQWRLCSDVFVVWSAECWTDHKLHKAKLRLTVPLKTKPGRSKKRYAISQLNDENIREKYNKLVVESVGDKWSSDAGGEKMCEILLDGVKKSAEKVLGWEKRRQPEWLRDSFVDLEKLISKHNLEVVGHTPSQDKAQEVEMVMRGGKGVWKEAMQRGRAGLRPVRSKAIRDCSGELCMHGCRRYSLPLVWAL